MVVCSKTDEKNNISERNYGIDFLRILSMFMVVILHVLAHGGVLDATKLMSSGYIAGWTLEIACYCAVNCYALISGYVGYGRKQKKSSIIYLTFSVLYYIIGLTILGYLFIPDVGVNDAITSAMHIRKNGYWYFKAYFCAFFFFPHINFLVEKYDKKSLYAILGTVFVLFSIIPTLLISDVFVTGQGYSPLWLMLLYFVGAVIKKYNLDKSRKSSVYFLIYLGMIVLTLLSMIIIGVITQSMFGQVSLDKVLISYTSPTMIIAGIALLIACSNFRFNILIRSIISFLSPLTFGVYLVHTQFFVWHYILKDRFVSYAEKNVCEMLFYVIVTAFVIYLLCCIVDYIRKWLFEKAGIKKLSEKIDHLLTIK